MLKGEGLFVCLGVVFVCFFVVIMDWLGKLLGFYVCIGL